MTDEASRRIKIGLECLFMLLSLMTEISDSVQPAFEASGHAVYGAPHDNAMAIGTR